MEPNALLAVKARPRPLVGEVNHIPLRVAEPALQVGDPVRGRPAIGGDAVDVRLALQQFPHREGVADGDGVADQQDTRQSVDVLDRSKSRIRRSFRLALRLLRIGRHRGHAEKATSNTENVGKAGDRV